MKYLSQKDFDHLQELVEAVVTAYAMARETRENKTSILGFDVVSFLFEKELYSDSIIGCAASATHYQDRRITDKALTKILDLNNCCAMGKYPHLNCFMNDETLQKKFPCAKLELQKLAEIKTILQEIASS